MAIAEYNTVDITQEQAKSVMGEPQDTSRWGFKFANPPKELGNPPEGFYIGFQTGSFPQEAVTYLEERVANFPVSWIGEVTRNGSMSITNLVAEKMEFIDYMDKWINLMGKATAKETTHKSAKTADIEATCIIFLLDGEGKRTLEFTIKFCKPEALIAPSGTNTPSIYSSGFGLKYDTFFRGIKS